MRFSKKQSVSAAERNYMKNKFIISFDSEPKQFIILEDDKRFFGLTEDREKATEFEATEESEDFVRTLAIITNMHNVSPEILPVVE